MLGHQVVETLVREGHQVTALVRSPAKAKRFVDDAATLVVGDMADVGAFAPSLAGHDAVIHTAAYFREYDGGARHAASLKRINVDGTLSLAMAAAQAGVRRFVDVSSGGIIGKKVDGSAGDEETPPAEIATRNRYFMSKLEAEKALRPRAQQLGLEAIWILPGMLFGPGDAGPTPAGAFVRNFMRGLGVVIPPGGIAVVDSRDVASAIALALERGRPDQRYIVSGPRVSMAEICGILSRLTGRRRPFSMTPTVSQLVAFGAEGLALISRTEPLLNRMTVQALGAELGLDASKATRELGATYRPLEESLKATVDWFTANPS